MAHGNFSDLAALVFLVTGLLLINVPAEFLTFSSYPGGTIKPFVDVSAADLATPTFLHVTKNFGMAIIAVAMIMSGVVWDDSNGKAAAVGFLFVAATIGYSFFVVQDKGVFIPRAAYGFVVFDTILAMWLWSRSCQCETCKNKKSSSKK